MLNKIYSNYLALFAGSIFLLFTSCDTGRVYEENKDIPDNTWKQNTSIEFNVDIKDTISLHNMYVNVRNSAGYSYSNLFLFIKTVFPKGEQTIDTLECTLADPSGKWLGEGLGDIWDNQILFKKNIRFPQSGQYKFKVEQAMRIDPLTSIMDIGLRIEKAEKK
jgi:gliding motility-associated lipoprotein GldH